MAHIVSGYQYLATVARSAWLAMIYIVSLNISTWLRQPVAHIVSLKRSAWLHQLVVHIESLNISFGSQWLILYLTEEKCMAKPVLTHFVSLNSNTWQQQPAAPLPAVS